MAICQLLFHLFAIQIAIYTFFLGNILFGPKPIKHISVLLVDWFIGFPDLVSEQFKDLDKFPQNFV